MKIKKIFRRYNVSYFMLLVVMSILIISILIISILIMSVPGLAILYDNSSSLIVDSQTNNILSINRQEFMAGETVEILIDNQQNLDFNDLALDIYLENDVNNYYKYIGLDNNAVIFIPNNPGKYIIKLYSLSGAQVYDEKYFLVFNNNQDCEQVVSGTEIMLDTNSISSSLNNVDLSISDPTYNNELIMLYYDPITFYTEKYTYSGEESIMPFKFDKQGKFILYYSGVYIKCFESRINIPEANIDALSDISTLFNTLLDQSPPGYDAGNYVDYDMFAHLEISSILGKNFTVSNEEQTIIEDKILSKGNEKSVKIKDSNGKFVNTYIIINDNVNSNTDNKTYSGNILDIQNQTINSTDSDAEIYFASGNVRKIVFKNINYQSKGIDFSIEDVPLSDLKQNRNPHDDFINAFAIDPVNTEFSEAIVTFTASGKALWKCKEYNFSSRTCYGDFIKMMDLSAGQVYSFVLTPEDPVFAQSGYLTNPSFENNTDGWTTLTESGLPDYAWVSLDAGQSGVAEISNTGNNKDYIGNYYQTFNLTIPQGTNLTNISFSALWRISNYDAPGNVYFWIQNSARTITYCEYAQSFSATTSWTIASLFTGINCGLSNFTSGSAYTVRLRCNLVTGKSIRDERCHWDNVTVTVYYTDTQAPSINSFSETPKIVNYGAAINFTANITDNVQVDKVWLIINGSTYFMNPSAGTYYYDSFNTAIYPMTYNYTIYANDTSNNIISNSTGNFTVNDSIAPIINLMNPANNSFSNVLSNTFYYNVSDESTIMNCSLLIDSVIISTNYSVQKIIQQSFTASLTEGNKNWYIRCFDNSTNRNVNNSEVRRIIIDTIKPVVALNYPPNNTYVTGGINKLISFNYTPSDMNIKNCSLYGNFSGTYSFYSVNNAPVNGSINNFSIVLNDGRYIWNVLCCDNALNCAFNSTNSTALIDSTPPYYYTIINTPSSASKFALRNYEFNITWNDLLNNVGVVLLENNFSGSIQNSTVIKSGTTYSYQISNLPAGNYYYKWYANDTLNNINFTSSLNYQVLRADSNVTLLLNGSDADIFIGQGDYVNITAILNIPSSGYIELYLDGVLINSGNNLLINITQFTLQQQYNITAVYVQTQNYSTSSTTHYVTVTDTQPPTIGLNNPVNNSWQPNNVTVYYTPKDNIDIINCTLVLNGINNETKNATIDVENNFTVTLIDGLYNWTVSCRDSYNNYGINNTRKYFNVDTMKPSAFNLTSPSNESYSNNITPKLQWQQTTESNFYNYSVFVDNNIDFLSINHFYGTYNITNTSLQVPVIDSWTDYKWYWKVIAYDRAGNFYESKYFIYHVDTIQPSISILYPENNYYSNSRNVSFNFSLTDVSPISNCSLYINDSFDQILYNLNNSIYKFNKSFVDDGSYSWFIRCYDAANNNQSSASLNLVVDTLKPSAFSLLQPGNITMSTNNTPLFSWQQTTDTNFDNYTLLISDNNDFSYYNYSFITYPINNVSYQVITPLSDAVWYWKVVAYDKALNNFSTGYFVYEIKNLPPGAFDLVSPADNYSSNNTSPLLVWGQTQDSHFENYTIQVSTNSSFYYLNYSYATYQIDNTSYQAVNWPMNNVWYWRVSAYDVANNNYTTYMWKYVTDNATPIVRLVAPFNTSLWNTSSVVDFKFNVSDISDISNCSLIIGGVSSNQIENVDKNVNVTIQYALSNGLYNWSINCTDNAGFTGASPTYRVTVDVFIPGNLLYETSNSGTALLTTPANVNLSYGYDFVENYALQSVGAAIDYNIANATITWNATGFILYAGSIINISGSVMPSANNRGYVNWGVYVQNSSGIFDICSTPAGASGYIIPTRNIKNTIIGNCVSPSYDILFKPGDSIILRVNVYSSSTATYTHYIDNANPSYIILPGYKLGNLSVNFINITDTNPGEGEEFIERCNISCVDGWCLANAVTLEMNNSALGWQPISSTGNIILNGTQTNPLYIGNINSTYTANFTLYANNYSFNNSIRCIVNSTYSDAVSIKKNVTVTDKTPPIVELINPANNYPTYPQIITFDYAATDPRLYNCSLYTNVTGAWSINQTNSSPITGQESSFQLNLSYGRYLWNVKCCDTLGNCGFNDTNRTLIIDGDLAIFNDSIYFSTNTFVEGQNITIYANISNLANKTEQNVLIRFYDGDPDTIGIQIGTDKYVNITGLSNVTVNTSYITKTGQSDIYVVVDMLDSVVESEENNNKAFKTISIAAWQIYYGNITSVKLLASNTSILNWSFSDEFAANIYITDSDSNVNWNFVKALSRDTLDNYNANTINDFTDLDLCLGTENFSDSVNESYTINSNPKQTSSYTIFSNIINYVPEDMSTNTTNFYTGILWDTDDSADSYYDCQSILSLREDIVFVTRTNKNKQGAFGYYDYEIKVPAKLKSYKGTIDTVTFYYEII